MSHENCRYANAPFDIVKARCVSFERDGVPKARDTDFELLNSLSIILLVLNVRCTCGKMPCLCSVCGEGEGRNTLS